MNLYLITAKTRGYDVFDSAVVAAETESDARHTHPANCYKGRWWEEGAYFATMCWVVPSEVSAELIGVASEGTEPSVICASFNAG
jgi:hypothetical protein